MYPKDLVFQKNREINKIKNIIIQFCKERLPRMFLNNLVDDIFHSIKKNEEGHDGKFNIILNIICNNTIIIKSL